jgi:hypothetical protein
MFSYGPEGAAQIDKGGAIQVQRRHGRAAGGRSPFDVQEVRAPGEMA